MTYRDNISFVALILSFVFCQVLGTMCAMPDLSPAAASVRLADAMGGMACPMDGGIMCPPSATSSPERQFKQAAAIEPDLTPAVPAAILSAAAIPIPWAWSSVLSIAPVSIASSPVLRI